MELYECLKKYFGYLEFRGPQKPLIEKIINNKDILAILPTGFGKSLIYQVGGLMLEGLTIVITPLISLMQDQVLNLRKKGIRASAINSLMTKEEINEAYENINTYSFLYVSPERLLNKRFLNAIKDPRLVVIDEAHTLLWGLEFRPHMLDIKKFIKALPKRPVVAAFTATANRFTIYYIIKALGLNRPYLERHLPINKNIRIEPLFGKPDYLLAALLKKHRDSKIIIYSLTQAKAMAIYNKYKDSLKISYYHGGLERSQKVINQDLFTKGRVNIISATVAFGMGIDLPDIRVIILYDIPLTLADLIQEIGRAGRDGKPSLAYLIYSKEGLKRANLLISDSNNILRSKRELDIVKGFYYTRDFNRYIKKYFK